MKQHTKSAVILLVVAANGAAAIVSRADAGLRGVGHADTELFENAAYALSANGQVMVGYHTPPDGPLAFRWTAAEGLTSLGLVVEGDINSTARGVSADGIFVVGDGAKLRGHDAFRWSAAGGMVSLGNLRGVARFFGNSTAHDVSDDGAVVVGVSENAEFNGEAFLWTEASGMLGLGDLFGGIFDSAAFGVSGDGQVIVGQSSSALGDEAFSWTLLGGMTGLGDFAGGLESSAATDASGDGAVIVGWGTASSDENPEGFQSQAFRWTQATGLLSLGDLPGGRFFSQANAVSADGSVVVGQGTSGNAPQTAGLEAFVWTQRRGMRSVRDVLAAAGVDMTGWVLTSATGVSGDGRTVAGFGERNGRGEAWIATLPPDCPGDFNGSGTVTVQDVFDFLAAFFANDLRADVNISGSVTVQDVFDFLAGYFESCV
jgi:probable HAF family extracellular repeat protein